MLLTVYCLFIKKFLRGQGRLCSSMGGGACATAQWHNGQSKPALRLAYDSVFVFGRIWIDHSAHYLASKRIWCKYSVQPALVRRSSLNSRKRLRKGGKPPPLHLYRTGPPPILIRHWWLGANDHRVSDFRSGRGSAYQTRSTTGSSRSWTSGFDLVPTPMQLLGVTVCLH